MSTKIAPEQALSRLQRLCSRAEKCVADIRRKLLEWEFAPGEASKIIARLQADGFVNERRYAKAFVHDKITLSLWGVLKIHKALKYKKIDDEIIHEALSGIDKLTQEQALAYLLSHKNKCLKPASLAGRKIKLLRFAMGRGFEYEMAKRAVDELLK
ncbi:MAG: RecX family transcriptional regulator [Prevotellaceae bacterium]|jgi:regulatory protein|nr:RecX family transcriptional regulator [Prevotellaceae bacterium]